MGCKKALCISALLMLFNLLCPLNSMDTITSTQFISYGNHESLVSSDGKFKLGFFSPGKSRFRYIGIWFNKISVQTVVWVANRETPIKNFEGILKIGVDGNLAVFDGNDSSPLWSTNVSVPTGTSSAKLLESGNLVLVTENKRDETEIILWQSFDYPTGTLLPGMKFGMNKKTGLISAISSWKTSDDPAPGKFSCRVDHTVSPQFFLYKGGVPYWRAGPWNGRNLNDMPDLSTPLQDRRIEFTYQFDLINYTIVSNDDEFYAMVSSKNNAPIYIAVLDSMGNFQRLVWHEYKTWTRFWTVPHDLCDEYARCGSNAMCNEDMMMRCKCLPGFEPLYPQNWNLECIEKGKVDGCGKGDGEGFVRLEGVKVPDARTSKLYSNMSLEECERKCLKSCNCTGYASADVNEDRRGCWAWYGKLIDMRLHEDGRSGARHI